MGTRVFGVEAARRIARRPGPGPAGCPVRARTGVGSVPGPLGGAPGDPVEQGGVGTHLGVPASRRALEVGAAVQLTAEQDALLRAFLS
ncbi:hypothetical protein CLV63_12229 [Murinocardiopsis flavida]|uniref:Uncharacterized protein n=1 Tax=Murinocardiopsis flavida TaxID=645275 RepID=A0A2P8CZU9_9ACTN|nr:hypothetical protein CLV63_12229 [Murinocardiopsis flavida]